MIEKIILEIAARRALLRMKVDYTVELVWIMSKYNSCSRASLEQLLKAPTIRKHVAEKLPRITELLNDFSQDGKPAD